jgi:hypothetical protein
MSVVPFVRLASADVFFLQSGSLINLHDMPLIPAGRCALARLVFPSTQSLIFDVIVGLTLLFDRTSHCTGGDCIPVSELETISGPEHVTKSELVNEQVEQRVIREGAPQLVGALPSA